MNELTVTINSRSDVFVAEEMMKAYGEPVAIPVREYFANKGTKRGTYAREITIPAGTLLTGKIHKYEQVNFLLRGEITVLTDDGFKRLVGPATVVSPAGTKRIAYTHTECVWTTVHSTELEDVDAIEAEFIAQTEEEYLEFVRDLALKETLCLG